ncbi:MAG: ATP-binding protein [Oleiphilus sp.]
MILANGFERLLCLDAHIPGKLLAIKIGQNANLNGTNGAGKTTLLKLISFFYGAPVRSLVRKIGTHHSFVDRYLPRPTSLLIMEYETDMGPACAVAYRNTTGDKPVFRFLAEPFKQEYFSEIRDGELKYVEGKALGRHWDMKQLRHSKQIEEVDNYRAIILADNAAINLKGRSKEYREYVHRYSLSNGRSSLRHIDKISAAILNRSADMNGMKEMIANIMEEDNVILPPLDIHRGLVSEISQLKVIRDLENFQDEFVKTISNGKSFRENKEQIAHCVAELKIIKEGLEAKKLLAIEEQKNIGKKIGELQGAWEEQEHTLASAKTDASAAVESTQKHLDNLDDEKRGWEDQDIDHKVVDLSNLANYELSLAQAQKVLDALEEGVQDLRKFRDSRNIEEYERNKVAEKLLQKQRDGFLSKREELSEKAQERTNELSRQLTTDLNEKRSERHNGLVKLVKSLEKIRARIENPAYTQDELLAQHSAEQALEVAEARCEQAQTDKESLEENLNSARKNVDIADGDLREARRAKNTEQAIRDEIEALCNPKPGSFLSELREKDTQWYKTLGKVINPDLLARKDLEPTQLEASNSLMGWQIELDKIDAPSWAADMAEMERQLAEHKTAFNLAEDHFEACERNLRAACEDRDAIEGDYNEAKRVYSQAKQAVQSAKNGVESVKSKNDQSKDARAQEDRVQAKSAEESQARYEEQTQKLCEDIESNYTQALEDVQATLSADLVPVEEGLEKNLEASNQEAENHKGALVTIQSEYVKQCEEKGVSKSELERAEKDVKEKKEKVREVSAFREAVSEYKRWLDREWSRQKEISARLLIEKKASADAHETLETARANHKSERDALNKQKTQHEADIRKAKDDLDDCDSILKRLPTSKVIVSIARDIQLVLADSENLLEEQLTLLKSIESGLSKASQVLNNARESDKIGLAWVHKQQAAIGKLGEKDRDLPEQQKLAMVDALEELISTDLPMLKESLLNFVHNTGQNISRFYIGLKNISKDIMKQSSRISEAVSKDIKFNAISDITLKLISRIDELEFWSDLEKFYKLWARWISDGQHGLPPKEIDEQLVHVTQILSRSNTKTGLQAVFDLEIHLRENGQLQTARKDEELEAISSNGLSYLILVTILAGITRMLCRDQRVKIHWPMDELGVLAPENIPKLFALLNQHNIVMVGGFPTSDPNLLQHFKDHHQVRPGEGIAELALEEDKLAALMAQKLSKQEDETV